MSKKPKTTEEAFSPEQLAALEKKGDLEVQAQRQKEGLFQRYNARRDSKVLARQVKWKRRSGIALIVMVMVLFLLWLISWLYTAIGDLVISVDTTALRKGISVSLNADGSDPHSVLSAPMAAEVTNITYNWLPATLDLEADGSHNGRNYLAYTFYVTNSGGETLEYNSQLEASGVAKSADEAVRVMIYKNGEPSVYAKRNITDLNNNITKDPDAEVIPFETIYKKAVPEDYTPPTAKEIEAQAREVQNKEPVEVTDEVLPITEFKENDIVFSVKNEGLQPGKTDKYTIVIWIEGEDPECVNDIRGGYMKMHWFFNIEDEEL